MSKIMIGLMAISMLAACNNKGDNAQPVPPATVAPAPVPAPVSNPTTLPKVELEISAVGNLMKFDKTSLTVPAGSEVHLVIKNPATMSTMPHNWVLLAAGASAAKVAADGLVKGLAMGYVAPGSSVLAYTPLANPKGTAEVTFTAPPVGKYDYICTVPGHYMMMKGVLTVTQ